MLSLALAALVASAPAAETEAIVALPGGPSAQWVLSIYPLSPLAGLTAFASGPAAGVWLPVGLQVPLSRQLVLDVEASLAFTTTGPTVPGWAFTASAGPTWFPLGEQQGFFVGPRFNFLIGMAAPQAGVFINSPGPLDAGPFVRRAFLAGLDAGWQFRKGRVVFGPVVGASVGMHFDSRNAVVLPFEVMPMTRVRDTSRPHTFALGLNLTLFRLGVALQ